MNVVGVGIQSNDAIIKNRELILRDRNNEKFCFVSEITYPPVFSGLRYRTAWKMYNAKLTSIYYAYDINDDCVGLVPKNVFDSILDQLYFVVLISHRLRTVYVGINSVNAIRVCNHILNFEFGLQLTDTAYTWADFTSTWYYQKFIESGKYNISANLDVEVLNKYVTLGYKIICPTTRMGNTVVEQELRRWAENNRNIFAPYVSFNINNEEPNRKELSNFIGLFLKEYYDSFKHHPELKPFYNMRNPLFEFLGESHNEK